MIENHIAVSLPGMKLAFPTESLTVLCVAHVALITQHLMQAQHQISLQLPQS